MTAQTTKHALAARLAGWQAFKARKVAVQHSKGVNPSAIMEVPQSVWSAMSSEERFMFACSTPTMRAEMLANMLDMYGAD